MVYDRRFPEGPLNTIFGRYQALEKIGQGGMGVVYRAQDTLLERVVALKVIATTIHDNPDLRERFFREARAAGQLSHPNIITIHDLGEHEGQPYLAMEFLLGEDLQRRLQRPEPMSLARKLEIAADICDGLAFAHRRGVIHRDVKPANIFITDEGAVKILDFGLARMVASEATASNMMLGTLNYMAPEQVRGERTDHRADIFSFGVLFYEILCGRKAFQGDSYATTLYKILQEVPEPLLSLDPTLPPEVVRIVDRAIAKARDERYQELTDLGRDLAILRQQVSAADPAAAGPLSGSVRVQPESLAITAIQEARGVMTPAPAVPPAVPGRTRAMRPTAWLAAALVVALAAAGAWLALRGRGEAPAQAGSAAAPSLTPATESDVRPPPPALPAAPDPAAAGARDGRAAVLDAARRAAEEARTRAGAARSAALATGRAVEETAAFRGAAAAEREGRRLLQSGDFAEAAARFYVASTLFGSARAPEPAAAPPASSSQPLPSATRAGGAQPADGPPSGAVPQVPAPQAAAPAPAPPPDPGPPASGAPVAEAPAQGTSIPTPPPPTPPARAERNEAPPAAAAPEPSPRAMEESVRDLVRRYGQALEGRSVDALRRLWPSLTSAQEAALRQEFMHARRIQVVVDDVQVTLAGSSATATFVRRYGLDTTDGQRLLTTSRTIMTARRAGGEWVIERVRFEPM